MTRGGKVAALAGVVVAGVAAAGVAVLGGVVLGKVFGGVLCAVLYAVLAVVAGRRVWQVDTSSRDHGCTVCGGDAAIRGGMALWFCTAEHVEQWDDRYSW